MKIKIINTGEALDMRGNPTVEVSFEGCFYGKAIVPSQVKAKEKRIS